MSNTMKEEITVKDMKLSAYVLKIFLFIAFTFGLVGHMADANEVQVTFGSFIIAGVITIALYTAMVYDMHMDSLNVLVKVLTTIMALLVGVATILYTSHKAGTIAELIANSKLIIAGSAVAIAVAIIILSRLVFYVAKEMTSED